MKDLNGFVIKIGWIFMILTSNGYPVCQFLMNDAYFGWHLFVYALHIFFNCRILQNNLYRISAIAQESKCANNESKITFRR